jgi:transcriptional regulator with XRE-family HTH domain
MTFGEKMTFLRKQLKMSQDELAKKVGTSAPIIGRYEREEIKPSIDVAVRIADGLDVSLDYLFGKTDNVLIDKKNLSRLKNLESLPQEDKFCIYYAIDALIKAAKLKQL